MPKYLNVNMSGLDENEKHCGWHNAPESPEGR